jgi:hypothetical protein
MNAPAPRSQPTAEVTNQRYARELEGFARTLGAEAEGEALRCSTARVRSVLWGDDFRGTMKVPPCVGRRRIAWETAPAEAAERTVFTWIGGSSTWPAFRPAYPYATAVLSIDGAEPLRFPIAQPEGFRVERGGLALEFEPRQFQSLAEPYHRYWGYLGITGFYRLHVDAARLSPGRPLRIAIELPEEPRDHQAFYTLAPRRDVLRVDLRLLRDEVAQLQGDLVRLKRSHETLAAQIHPELFPERIRGERVIVTQDRTRHLHPATITVLADGEVVITAREGTDHLASDGRMIMVRSRDGGRSWGPRELMFDLGECDHRCAPVVELPNGDWLTTDYRPGGPGGIYATPDGAYRDHLEAPTLWGAWSSDRGRTWSFSTEPLTVPGSPSRFAEAERHMIRLPNGRLLVAASFYTAPETVDGIAVFSSDDDGRSWSCLAKAPVDPRVEGEPTLLRTRSGRIIMIVRTMTPYRLASGKGYDWHRWGGLLQSESLDDGRTWTTFRETGMGSMSSPGHLLQLADGRILCSHASRAYPGSIYATVSRDDGETWDVSATRVIADDLANFDSCYPTSGQLADGTIITTWYQNLFGKFFIAALRYPASAL